MWYNFGTDSWLRMYVYQNLGIIHTQMKHLTIFILGTQLKRKLRDIVMIINAYDNPTHVHPL